MKAILVLFVGAILVLSTGCSLMEHKTTKEEILNASIEGGCLLATVHSSKRSSREDFDISCK